MDKNKSLPSTPQYPISGRLRDFIALCPKINTRDSPNTLAATVRNAELRRDNQFKPLGRGENTTRPHNPTSSMNELNAIQNYVIPIKRTPSYLTPSQRLQLRRDQMSNSIVNYRLPGDDRVRSNRQTRRMISAMCLLLRITSTPSRATSKARGKSIGTQLTPTPQDLRQYGVTIVSLEETLPSAWTLNFHMTLIRIQIHIFE